jgi:hypothetical protein
MSGRERIIVIAAVITCIILASAVLLLTPPPLITEPVDPYLVAEEIARDHATAALVEFIVAGPGLAEDEAWKGATIGGESLLFFDRNGRPFVYQYSVKSGGMVIGSINIAARTVLGGSVMEYGITSPTFDPDDAIRLAVATTERTYPGWIIQEALPCYAPPVTGVLIWAMAVNDTEKLFLIDPASGMIVEREPADKCAAVDHLGRTLDPDEIESRIAVWRDINARYHEILSFAEGHDIDLRQILSEDDFESYMEFFRQREIVSTRTPPPVTPLSESELIAQQRELEEWQRTAEWDVAIAYDAALSDDEISAAIAEHLGEGSLPGGIRTSPGRSWLCLNASAANFAGYRARLENHSAFLVFCASDAFFWSVIENPKSVDDRTLWLLDIGQNPPEMDQEDIKNLLLAEGFPLEEIRFARMRSYPQDRDGREQFAERLNADARLLFVMKEYLM